MHILAATPEEEKPMLHRIIAALAAIALVGAMYISTDALARGGGGAAAAAGAAVPTLGRVAAVVRTQGLVAVVRTQGLVAVVPMRGRVAAVVRTQRRVAAVATSIAMSMSIVNRGVRSKADADYRCLSGRFVRSNHWPVNTGARFSTNARAASL